MTSSKKAWQDEEISECFRCPESCLLCECRPLCAETWERRFLRREDEEKTTEERDFVEASRQEASELRTEDRDDEQSEAKSRCSTIVVLPEPARRKEDRDDESCKAKSRLRRSRLFDPFWATRTSSTIASILPTNLPIAIPSTHAAGLRAQWRDQTDVVEATRTVSLAAEEEDPSEEHCYRVRILFFSKAHLLFALLT